MKTKIGTEVAHVTGDSDTTFIFQDQKVKGKGHQALWLADKITTKFIWTVDDTILIILRHHLSTLGRGHSVATSRLQLVSCAMQR